jgi:hypothetical protein
MTTNGSYLNNTELTVCWMTRIIPQLNLAQRTLKYGSSILSEYLCPSFTYNATRFTNPSLNTITISETLRRSLAAHILSVFHEILLLL